MKDLVFACAMGSGEGEKEALRLARSIRTFGGRFNFNSIWLFSQRSEEELAEPTRQELFSLGAHLIPYEAGEDEKDIPFAAYVAAAAIAEGLAQGEASCLAMMASDTLLLQPPDEFLLPAGISLGACPVHLKILGSAFDQPVDEFWDLIYRACNVDPANIHPVRTIVDEQLVRAYFNSGLLVVRPERGFFRAWQSSFVKIYRLPEFERFYSQSELYRIFMHQAVLAGCILSSLKPAEICQFPDEINYPLHLHMQVDRERRPQRLDQLITCRYEDFQEVFGNPDIINTIQIDQSMKDWLQI